MVIGYHIILTGYGHWFPNDPRGSMSHEVYSPELQPLAEHHYGRRKIQPPIEELRAFFREAQTKLKHPILWFNRAERQVIADVIGTAVRAENLTCYACAVMSNHVHVLIRKHRIKAEKMSEFIIESGREALLEMGFAHEDHPIFSARSCHVFKSSAAAMRTCVTYIENNYRNSNYDPPSQDFVVEYNDWPFHKG